MGCSEVTYYIIYVDKAKLKRGTNQNVYLYQNHQTSHLINEILWQAGINCYAEVLNLLYLY